MKDSTFTTGQISQLHEIERARVRAGLPGLRQDLQDLIRRSAVVADPKPKILGDTHYPEDYIRHDQAKVSWGKGWGKELGFRTFEDYLATIPEVPPELVDDDPRFPLLVLVDARLGIKKSCELLGIQNTFDDAYSIASDGSAAEPSVYWMRSQEGRRYVGQSMESCRAQFEEDEIGVTLQEGVMMVAQNQWGLFGWRMDCPGSVCAESRNLFSSIDWIHGEYYVVFLPDAEIPAGGTASRRV
ncbi:MAG: hypothetical protein V1745_03945 [Patescibacteria group bacterium]